MKLFAALLLVSFLSQGRSQFAPTGRPPVRPAETTAFSLEETTFPDNTYYGRTRCMVGTRTFNSDGEITSDTSFPSWCPGRQRYCAYFNYNISAFEEDGEVKNYNSQTGYCTEDPGEVTCESFIPFAELFGNVTNCRSSTCRSGSEYEVCNQFQGEPGFCPERNDGFATDIQLFPNCTLQNTVRSVAECVGILIESYSQDNGESQCRNAWDAMFQCVAQTATRCLASNCPSMLDEIQGFRSEYPEIVLNTIFINDADSFFDRMQENFGIDARFVIPLVCSGDELSVQQGVQQIQNFLQGLDLEEMIRDAGLPLDVCPGVIQRLQSAFFRFLPAVLGSQGPADITNAFGQMVQDFMQAFQGCNSVGVFGQVSALLNTFNVNLPIGTVVSLFQTVTNFLPEVLPFFPTPGPGQGPNPGPFVPGACPAEQYRPRGFGQVQLNCQRFYDDQTRCGRRRAWMCDYSSWRLNFLRSWRVEWDRNNNSNDTVDWNDILPACRQEDDVRCARSQRCCYSTYDGCTVCFCQQQDYLEPEFLEGRWGEEASAWDRFFNRYQLILADQLRNNRENNNNNNNNNDDDTC